jgi:(p)ppGpp synthase/HD superfamily hydrolase
MSGQGISESVHPRQQQRTPMATLGKAIAIAAQAHQDQYDKAGAPYILHPLRMMLRMSSETEMMVAILHDVVEDTAWTPDQLRQAGFSEEIVQAVECLTHRDRETYDEFIARVRTNVIASKVKLADLEDNMDMRRLSILTEKDAERMHKYHRAWLALRQVEDTAR